MYLQGTSYRIGVDVGGTNTDAVLFCSDPEAHTWTNRGVIASVKKPTTSVVSDGIEAAIKALLEQTQVPSGRVSGVMIGTTHFMNAVVEADSRKLSKVAVVRLGAPYTQECPPFLDFPSTIRKVVEGYVCILKGGLEIDGRIIKEIDADEIQVQCQKIKNLGLKAVAIVGICSPLDKTDGTSQEERARNIMLKYLDPSTSIVCSRNVGQFGLLERENASILNASIMAFAKKTISGFRKAMHRLGLSCPLFLTQNDGTLTSAESAERLPIRTFSSGATNSMRGAAYLAGLGSSSSKLRQETNQSIIVVDIGGTTTDVGVLLPNGLPRQAAAFVKVGGVRTNFSMPDVYSLGLGGGSRIHIKAASESTTEVVTVGPDSVGYQLLTEGLVFGGSTLTTTDIVVADDPSLNIGQPTNVSWDKISKNVKRKAKVAIKKLLEDAIDRMKTSPEPATVILVGGGSIIAPKDLEGVGELILPPCFSCANAVGACIANVAGEIDTIEILQNRDLEEVIEHCKSIAIARAVKAGAKADTVKVVEIENLPVQYVTKKATRIIVKAIGELDTVAFANSELVSDDPTHVIDTQTEEVNHISTYEDSVSNLEVSEEVDPETYVPVVTEKSEWLLSETDLEWIAEGCGILGAGGGGSPYPPFIMARQIVRDCGIIRVISDDSLPDDALVFRGIFMGSPSVSNERVQSGTEIATACQHLARFIGIDKPAAIISDEIGGGNGIQPLILASGKHLNVPVFDGDLMGRAYPNMWQTLPAAYGVPSALTPCAIADGVGNSIILPSTSSVYMVETILRTVCAELGSKAGVSMAPLKAETCRKFGIPKMVSQAWRIGRAVAIEKKRSNVNGIPEAILRTQNGKVLYKGKIVNVSREVRAGFTWGTVTVMPFSNAEEEFNSKPEERIGQPDDRLLISFQNENLTAELFPKGDKNNKKLLAIVPDLISVLDSQSGSSLGTHEYRYGLRVVVIALASHPLWTTAQGLQYGGPEAFGLDHVYQRMANYLHPVSVIGEFRKTEQ